MNNETDVINSSSDICPFMKSNEHGDAVSPAASPNDIGLGVSCALLFPLPPEAGESGMDSEGAELVELVTTDDDSEGANSLRTRGKFADFGGDPKPDSRLASSSSRWSLWNES